MTIIDIHSHWGTRRGYPLQTEQELAQQRADFRATNKARLWPELATNTSTLGTDPEKRWPEIAMAHSDCYACHHELVPASWRQTTKGYYAGREPGSPPWQTIWPVTRPSASKMGAPMPTAPVIRSPWDVA